MLRIDTAGIFITVNYLAWEYFGLENAQVSDQLPGLSASKQYNNTAHKVDRLGMNDWLARDACEYNWRKECSCACCQQQKDAIL